MRARAARLPPWLLAALIAITLFTYRSLAQGLLQRAVRGPDLVAGAALALINGLYALGALRRSRRVRAGDEAALVYPSGLERAALVIPAVLLAAGVVGVAVVLVLGHVPNQAG